MRSTSSANDVTVELEEIARRLDVPTSLYEEARERYDAVCRWLAEDDVLLSYDPAMYSQGSFVLGTVTRPPGDLHYDVDAVCLLHASSAEVTQKELKRLVGDRLKAHETYASMLSPPSGGRRCWTLDYAESARFHLDILPAIPDDQNTLISSGVDAEFAKHAILITDTHSWDSASEWPRSNPKGYAEWFKARMKVRLDELRKSAAARHDASIESVPEYTIRTPLQQMIQLFKRHRDVRFGDDEDRPISIIITTLAAWAYSNEPDLSEAISNAVPRMRSAITSASGEYWVANPVNPHENFADKWNESPRKARLFHEWLDVLEREHESLLRTTLVEKRADALDKSFGVRPPSNTPSGRSRGLSLGLVPSSQSTQLRFDLPHREKPPWPVRSQYQVKVTAEATRDGYRKRRVRSGDAIGRHWSLEFEATTNAPMGAQYYWQVVNTGREATKAQGLRGQFVKGDRTRLESTLYAGTHWVEVFVVHQGTCIGRSGEFVVVIG